MIDQIGWTLVHAAWQGGLIAASLAVALRFTTRARPQVRYLIAVAAMFVMVAAPIATTIATRASAPSARVLETGAVAAPIAAAGARGASLEDSRAASSAAAERRVPGAAIGNRIDKALPWLVALWMLGIFILSARVIAAVARIQRLRGDGVDTVDATLRAVVERLSGRLGIRSAVRVLRSARVDTPMVVGWLRPVVLVPTALLSGVAPAHLEMILAHELAHVRRYDTFVNLAQTIVETLLFYHPAAWWVSARIREEREHCCDELALSVSGNDRRAYGAALLVLEESRGIMLAAAATDGSLLRRVRRIVFGEPGRIDLGPSWFGALAMMSTVIIVGLSTVAPAAASRPAAPIPTIAAPAATTAPDELRKTPTTSSHPASPPSRPAPRITSPSAESTHVTRSSLLASAAAIAIAATNAGAQSLNVSGRWVVARDSVAPVVTIEQTDRALTISGTKEGASGKASFEIEGLDRSAVKIKGPISATGTFNGGEFTYDATTSRVRGQFNGNAVEFTASIAAANFGVPTYALATLTIDSAGDLIVDLEIPATDKQPAKRTTERLKRAP